MLNIIEPFNPAGAEGGEVRPDDLLRYGDKWDRLLHGAFPLLTQVPQPLRDYISTTKMGENLQGQYKRAADAIHQDMLLCWNR